MNALGCFPPLILSVREMGAEHLQPRAERRADTCRNNFGERSHLQVSAQIGKSQTLNGPLRREQPDTPIELKSTGILVNDHNKAPTL